MRKTEPTKERRPIRFLDRVVFRDRIIEKEVRLIDAEFREVTKAEFSLKP